MLCQDSLAVASGPGYCVACTIFCRSWGCEVCAPRRRRQLIGLALRGEPTKFLTLTTNGNRHPDRIQAAHALIDAWNKLRKRIGRYLGGQKVEYCWAMEQTKAGRPHLHILLRCDFIPQRWISQQMRDLIGAPIVHIEAVDEKKGAARYIAKYLGKEPHRFGTCRRYSRSKGYDLSEPDEETDAWWAALEWTIEHDDINHYVGIFLSGDFPNRYLSKEIAGWGAVRWRGRRTDDNTEPWDA